MVARCSPLALDPSGGDGYQGRLLGLPGTQDWADPRVDDFAFVTYGRTASTANEIWIKGFGVADHYSVRSEWRGRRRRDGEVIAGNGDVVRVNQGRAPSELPGARSVNSQLRWPKSRTAGRVAVAA